MTPRCTDCGGPLSRGGGRNRPEGTTCLVCQVERALRDFHYPASQSMQALRRERKDADRRQVEKKR